MVAASGFSCLFYVLGFTIAESYQDRQLGDFAISGINYFRSGKKVMFESSSSLKLNCEVVNLVCL